jgi:hypothetical protein
VAQAVTRLFRVGPECGQSPVVIRMASHDSP